PAPGGAPRARTCGKVLRSLLRSSASLDTRRLGFGKIQRSRQATQSKAPHGSKAPRLPRSGYSLRAATAHAAAMDRRTAALLLFAVLAFSCPAAAAEWLAGDSPALPADRVIDDDLYVAGGNVHVAGDVRGDLVVAGGDLLLEGA